MEFQFSNLLCGFCASCTIKLIQLFWLHILELLFYMNLFAFLVTVLVVVRGIVLYHKRE